MIRDFVRLPHTKLTRINTASLEAKFLFPSPIQIVLFLPFQNGERPFSVVVQVMHCTKHISKSVIILNNEYDCQSGNQEKSMSVVLVVCDDSDGGLVYVQGNIPSYKHHNDTAMSRTVRTRKTWVSC